MIRPEAISRPGPSTITLASPAVTRACGGVGPAQPVLPGLVKMLPFVPLTRSEGAGPTEANILATSMNESCIASKFCKTKGLQRDG